MAPALPAGLIGREAAACVLLGAVLGGARALFPEKGRGAFLPDVLLVGALLLGLQSYAASLSFGGVLRWYQLAAAVFGAWAAERVLRGPVRGALFVLGLPLQGVRRLLAPGAAGPKSAFKTCQRTPERKKERKKTKKELAKTTADVV